MATREKTPRKRLKQARIPGTEPPVVREIEEAADSYVEARDRRMALLEEEVKLRDQLQFLMKKHELRHYDYDGQLVEFCAEEKVKVRKKQKEAADES